MTLRCRVISRPYILGSQPVPFFIEKIKTRFHIVFEIAFIFITERRRLSPVALQFSLVRHLFYPEFIAITKIMRASKEPTRQWMLYMHLSPSL